MLRSMAEVERIKDERRRDVLFASVLLRHFERGESLPAQPGSTTWRFLEDALRALQEERLFEVADDGPFLRATALGREAWRRLSSLLEGVRRLDVLARVNLHVELDEGASDDGVDVRDDVADPRFAAPSTSEEAAARGTEDLRLAVLTYLTSRGGAEREADPHRVTLLLYLADGRLSDDTAWFDLAHGAALLEINERAENAYRYSDVSDEERVIDDVVRHIYEAGVVERRKRSGEALVCASCGQEAPATSLWCPPCEEAWLRELASPLF